MTATDLAAGMGAVTTRRPFWRVVFWNMARIVVAAPVSERGDAPLEQSPLGVVVHEPQGLAVGGAGLLGAAEPAQELPTGRVEVVVVVEREAIDDLQARLGSLHLRHGDGA